jgi:sugar lactone lactonase YvrE
MHFSFRSKRCRARKGKATQVIYTVYDLPRPDASPHDVAFDADGNAWYSDFNSQYFGKLDVKTGKVVEYSPPLRRSGQIAQGGLQIDLDKQGRVYYGNMSQLQIVRLDPKTGKMETVRASHAGGHLGRRPSDDGRSSAHGCGWPTVVQHCVRYRRVGRHVARGSREEQVDARHLSKGKPLGTRV